ncbi:MAG: DEAD/DEAH box helicase [Puniceicoccales bacterium]|nr:DEAD/DEAH box helicase [Puniceicoccales bacterium]
MPDFSTSLKIPDRWQQDALHALRAGHDVIVQAPTGAGKTHIFEMLVRSGWRKKAVYTVPTRALANDKRHEWASQGFNVGIATGDIAENLDAPILVATLETQRGRFLHMSSGQPDLLVIDEFQMLGDPVRGVNYELVLALADSRTQLLLLSGSVANPDSVATWLRGLGRDVALINHHQRPVPLEEVFLDQLNHRIPDGIRGHWPRLIAKALLAELGPILVFAPRRKAAEELARHLVAALPLNDMLSLSTNQKTLAGDPLEKMLRNRIAYHHSGLSYEQRAELVEPLAKTGALRVVVATTGLGAGINFSMRSVIITDREYQSGHETRELRPDELLQMFGRAGRRGLDDRGVILVAAGKPRLAEGRPLILKRAANLDWSGFLTVMNQAVSSGQSPIEAAKALAARLFTTEKIELGLERLTQPKAVPAPDSNPSPRIKLIQQMQGMEGAWERLKSETKKSIKESWLRINDKWFPAASRPETFSQIPLGSLCKFSENEKPVYGRLVPIATFPRTDDTDDLVIAKWIHRKLQESARTAGKKKNRRPQGEKNRPPPPQATISKYWPLEAIEEKIIPRLSQLSGGGVVTGEPFERNGTLFVRLDYRNALVRVRIDSDGNALINPRSREQEFEDISIGETLADSMDGTGLTGLLWQKLGLIDHTATPTRRGIIASYFHQCEGLAIAAALEDESYTIRELVRDLANLRAGHRFENLRTASNRLGACCSLTYRGITIPGYLREGMPLEYGAGAAETLMELEKNPGGAQRMTDEFLNIGDIERARLEWESLLNHIVHAPAYPWNRWLALQEAARKISYQVAQASSLP